MRQTKPVFLDRQHSRWSKAIKTARHQLGLTQQQASELLGVSQSTLAGWERGHRIPAEHLRGTVITRLGINPADVRPEWAA